VSPDYRAALLLTATALPAGSAVPVVRETLIELLSASTAQPAPDSLCERMFTATEVGELLGTTKRWVYNQLTSSGGGSSPAAAYDSPSRRSGAA